MSIGTIKTDRATVTASCADSESGITKYEFSKDGTNWTANGKTNTYTFTGLTSGTTYTYYVRCTNGANTIIEGGEIGSIFGWEQSAYTIYGGAKIGLLRTIGIRNSSMGAVTVKDASIGELIMDPNFGTMKPMLTISSEAQISTLRFCATDEAAFKDSDYWKSVSISADAVIGKVIVGETVYSLADFLEEYK